MEEIRVCNPFEFKGMLEFSGKSFKGAYSSILNNVLDYIMTGNNLTIVIRSKSDGIGELNLTTGFYDGCLGQLQRNESDILTQLVDYPLNVTDTKQGDIGMNALVQFVGLYKPRTIEEVNAVTIVSYFKSFSIDIWLLCIVTALFAYMLLMIRSKIRIKIRTMIELEKEKLKTDRINYFFKSKFYINSSFESKYHRPHRNRRKITLSSKRAKIKRINNYFLSNLLRHMLRLGILDKQNNFYFFVYFFSRDSSLFSHLNQN